MHQRDDQLRRDLSELLALLLFDELAAVQEWYDCTVPYVHRSTSCLENLEKVRKLKNGRRKIGENDDESISRGEF